MKVISLTVTIVLGMCVGSAYGQAARPARPAPLRPCPARPVPTRPVPTYPNCQSYNSVPILVPGVWDPPHYHAATACESYMRGAAAVIAAQGGVIAAQGVRNRLTAQAAKDVQEARRTAEENKQQRIKNFREQREAYKAFRAQERALHHI